MSDTGWAAGFGRSRRQSIRQFVAFGVVGLGASPTTGAVLAFTVGTLASYVGTAMLSFRTRLRHSHFGRFTMVVLVGLALNAAMAHTWAARGGQHVAVSLPTLLSLPLLDLSGHGLWKLR